MDLPKELSCEAGSFSHHLNSHTFFHSGFKALFPCAGTLGCAICLTPELFLLQMWDCLLCQPPPCCESSPPSCLSPPLLPVWMNVSPLNPWLLDFITVQFPVSSGCFFVFKFVVILLLVVRGGTVSLPMPLCWPEISFSSIQFSLTQVLNHSV